MENNDELQQLYEMTEEEIKNKIKRIIILDGIPRGKTRFTTFAKDLGIWIWSINYINVLTAISHKVYWNGNRDRKFYDFLTEFSELVNRYFNFEENYVKTMLEKFERNNRVDVLVIHNCSENVKNALYKAYDKICFGIKITDNNNMDNKYHYILNCESKTYDEDIKKLLEILLEKGDI